MEPFRIFIVEDDPLYSELLKYHLSMNPDFLIEVFQSGRECLNNLYKKPAIISVDYSLPDMSGKELLEKIRRSLPEAGIIIVSGQKDISTAVELLKEGAFDYIVKDEETPSRLWNSIRLLRETISLKVENEKLREEVGKKYDFSVAIQGKSPAIRETFRLMEKAAGSQITVSVTGETGTGKELVAKAIHYNSERKKHPFIPVNVGAIPKELVESELFGYEKGAFTGAVHRKLGLFEEANLGSIFLDEITEMDLNVQAKFLRVLQEREIRRLGGSQIIKIDVRVITATYKNLAEEVKKGNFRSDLFYRIIGLPIHLAPLRERGNDIMILARYFADGYCRENSRKRVDFTEDAIKKLMSYSYPGNIRELKATVELAIILSDESKIDVGHISFIPFQSDEIIINEGFNLESYILKIVGDYMKKYNNPTTVARKLGISRATIYRYLKQINNKKEAPDEASFKTSGKT